MEIVMQMRYMNGFLRELSENILNHIKILSDWRTKTIRDYVELSFIGFSRSEVGGFGSTDLGIMLMLMTETWYVQVSKTVATAAIMKLLIGPDGSTYYP